MDNTRCLCLVDGEHYPSVIAWSLKELEKTGAIISGIIFLGGSEKVKDATEDLHFGNGEIPIYVLHTGCDEHSKVSEIVRNTNPQYAIDLSDDPVVSFHRRIHLTTLFLSLGIPYLGGDFQFFPPSKNNLLTKPSISIWGTNKRVGKTAISVYTARTLTQRGISPVILSMGRGGPEEPMKVLPEEIECTPDYLLKISEEGFHAASDYWEDAFLSEVPVVGCRRCGGGMAGNPFISNVKEGAKIASTIPEDVLILEGSGPTAPPIRTDKNILIINAGIEPEHSVDFFGEYRVLMADLIILTMCEPPMAKEEKVKALTEKIRTMKRNVPIAHTVFRPVVKGQVEGKNVILAVTEGTGLDEQKGYIEKRYNCKVSHATASLSDRSALTQELKRELQKTDGLITEIKAASIDIAAKMAKEKGKEIFFLHHTPQLTGGTTDNLEEEIISLFDTTRILKES